MEGLKRLREGWEGAGSFSLKNEKNVRAGFIKTRNGGESR